MKADSISGKKAFYDVYRLADFKELKPEDFYAEDINYNLMTDESEDDGKDSYPPDDSDGELDFGIKDFVTIFGDGKININTAPLEILSVMPGLDEEAARDIVSDRSRRPFEKIDELKDSVDIDENSYAEVLAWAKVKSDIFRIFVKAMPSGASSDLTVTAVVDFSGQKARIIYWRQDQ
jgi:hypothetical protein